MGELHTGPKHRQSDADSESYFDLRVVPLDTNQNERATAGIWCNITRLTLSGWDTLALVGRPPISGEL